ncbi:sensor histidine kinase [Echinicola strongylocentroti]|uniref:histidine kinase n=1 Tax=Echinicola strongylocentroti TaxID=1795355 RepID=A0A2Z4ICX1_9BACT|nr:HAMP domain-containing sensor histidine kinase [Echinicola strongylocentroti]AWW28689.1 sensor histidine kinase [Echinicola strongylocentroti]
MKLLNQSLTYLSISILLIVSLWSVVFYVNMLDEIYDSIDDGLANYKLLIINKAAEDSTIFSKNEFGESNYALWPIDKSEALQVKDSYKDTLMYMLDEDDKEPVRMLTTAFEHEGQYYKLEVISSMVEEDDLIEDMFWAIFWLYLLLIISILFVNNIILKKVWRPFYSFLEQIKAFRVNKASPLPTMETRTKEFLELKRSCDQLINHTLDAYANQKQFTENAAHELQTPLAIITSKLELLLEQNSMENADAAIAAEVLQITARLTQLNKSLLLLSKIENKQFFDNQAISFKELVEQSMIDFEDFASFKEVLVKMEASQEVTVTMDRMLASTMINNLIKNAIIHNQAGGEVIIQLQQGKLIIHNTATDGSLDAAQIFKRFYKNGQSQQNTGLGLSIVEAICHLYGFGISYQHIEGKHGFCVDFGV